METDQLIATEKFCAYYNVNFTFVESLLEIGLVETITVEETQYLHVPHLHEIERMIRLHDDLDINAEGIEAVHILLHRINEMKNEILVLKNRLRFYEG